MPGQTNESIKYCKSKQGASSINVKIFVEPLVPSLSFVSMGGHCPLVKAALKTCGTAEPRLRQHVSLATKPLHFLPEISGLLRKVRYLFSQEQPGGIWNMNCAQVPILNEDLKMGSFVHLKIVHFQRPCVLADPARSVLRRNHWVWANNQV